MCGIVGYIGKRDAYPVLIKGLKRLEYRGYDSAGVALIDKKRRLNVYKTKGKVSDLEAFVSQKDVSGTIGIAHTRWATHGEPCQANAHPHFSSSKNLALIHNGIIENYATLKEKLQKKGFIFKSSTDTEVLVQLIEFFQLSNHLDLLTAVQLALHEVIGAYAIAVLDKNNPDEIIAARKSSPLVVGIGKDEFFLASDATPIVEYTDKVVYLQDGEIAVIRRDKALEVVNLDNVLQNPEVRTVEMNLGQLEKENTIIISEGDHLGKIFFKDIYSSLRLHICEYTFEEHDKVVAYSLGIPFASTMVFAATMKHQDAPGTTFKRHMKIARGLLSEDDYLLTEILFNPRTPRQIERIQEELHILQEIIKDKDSEKMKEYLTKIRKNIE